MTHTFRIEDGTATMTSQAQTDGGSIEIACKSEQGEDVRLRLVFTRDGLESFQRLFQSFVRASAAAQDGPGEGRTPAAEPTSGTASEMAGKHIDRYAISLMSVDQMNQLLEALRPYVDGGQKAQEKAPEYDGTNRIVMWRVPDAPGGDASGYGFRVYLSEGALRAARSEGVEIRTEGEVSRREVPEGRELLIGDPPMDWQDTTF